jgi:hypothetical protein
MTKHKNSNKQGHAGSALSMRVSNKETWIGGQQLVTIRLKYSVTNATTTIGGSLTDVIPVTLANANQAASYAALFDEYRILGAKLMFVPPIISGTPSGTAIDAIVVVDYDNSAALGSYSAAWQYDNAKHLICNQKMKILYHPTRIAPDDQWYNTSAPVAVAWFKVYGSGGSISTSYGRYYVQLDVQFRGVV